MPYLPNYNTDFIYKKPQEHISKNCVSILGHLQQLSYCNLDWGYTPYQIPASYYTLGNVIYKSNAIKIVEYFFVLFYLVMFIHIRWCINKIEHSMLDTPMKKLFIKKKDPE